jgi:hypothetical protein
LLFSYRAYDNAFAAQTDFFAEIVQGKFARFFAAGEGIEEFIAVNMDVP